MHGEKGVESTIVDISDNDEAINHRFFTYELSRKCVDYSFDLLQIRGSSPLSIVGYDKDTLVVHVYKFEGNNTDYSFNNMNRVENLKWEKKQSSVVLTWDTSGGESDFYRVLRRDHGTTAWTDTIADNIQQTFVEDKKVYVQQVYDYMVESITQCEGVHIVRSDVETGNCEPTAMVCGYVRMADGTGMAGVKVIITPEGDLTESLNSAQYEVFTDNTGYYEKKGLKYRGEGKF